MMNRALVLILVLFSTLGFPDAHARLIDEGRDVSCDVTTTEGNAKARFIESLCRLTTNDIMQWINLARSSEQSDRDELQQDVQKRLGRASETQSQSIVQVLAIVGRLNIAPDHMRDRVVTIALRQSSLVGRIHRTPVSNSEIQILRQAAGAALLREPARVDLAQSLLDRAVSSACESKDTKIHPSCMHMTAEIYRDLAWLAESKLEFGNAAQFYEFAAKVGSLVNNDARRDLSKAANFWIDHAEATGQRPAFKEAARSYQKILDQTTHADDPLLWTRTQINLGISLARLGESELDLNKLRRSAEALRAGLDSFDENDMVRNPAIPVARANLGVTLYLIGELSIDSKSLEQSITEFQAALGQVERAHQPYLWASLKNNLGISFLLLGQRTNDIKMLRKASDAVRDTLSIWTREHAPEKWAVTQINLGNALRETGISSASNSTLEEAVIAYREALAELTREHQPLDWALAQSNLGIALLTIGSNTKNLSLVQEAVNSFRFALEVLKKDDDSKEWGITQDALGEAQYEVAVSKRSIPDMEAAISSLHVALEVRDRAFSPLARAQTLDILFKAHTFVGVQDKDPLQLEQALAAIKEAREIRVIDLKMDDIEARYDDQINEVSRAIKKLKSHFRNDGEPGIQ